MQQERITGDDLEVRRLQRQKTTEILRNGRTPLHVVQIAKNAATLADAAIANAQRRQAPARPLACAEGCAWCCHQRVGTAAPEVIRIVQYLQQHLPPAVLQQLHARIAQLDERRRALANDAWAAAHLPCPLLENQRCLAYLVRPVTCRGANSTDARRCEQSVTERARANVPAHVPSQRLAAMALDGLRAGVAEAGLDGEHLELTAALRIAFEQPHAADEWVQGGKAFGAARLPT